MATRASARSSAARDKLPPSPRSSRELRSQSPTGRRTRATRSQSVELGEPEIPANTATYPNARRGAKRGARRLSVESVDSNTSAASSRGARTRTRAARDLSTVAEIREIEEEEEEEVEEIEEIEEDEDGEVEDGAQAQRSHSPSGLSQISGTTAISSFSANRSTHSSGEMASLDPMMAEFLPELWDTSYKILDLLAPMDASAQDMEAIVRELKRPGSRLAKRLKFDEGKFNLTRNNYGHASGPYIGVPLVLRKLLGSSEPAEGDFRPDSIIYTANLATLVKDLLVNQKESIGTNNNLMGLIRFFPTAFVSRFDNSLQFGSSALLEDSFEIALDIRTQFTIISLGYHKDEEGFNPEPILATNFYDLPTQPTPPLSYLEDIVRNGRAKDMLGHGISVSADQVSRIQERVHEIHSTFRQSSNAVEAGDLVDFEELEEKFPWLEFLTRIASWTRLRLGEISESIRQQGGVQNITKSLIAVIQSNDSQVEISYDPPPASSAMTKAQRKHRPPPGITPASPGVSHFTKSNVQFFKMKRKITSRDVPPSNQQQETSSVVISSAQQPESLDEFRHAMNEKGIYDTEDGQGRYASFWNSHISERNKENRDSAPPKPHKRRRLIDSQPGAEKVEWEEDSSDSMAGQQRTRHEQEETEESDDQGFEEDQRVPDPARRVTAPPAQHRAPVPNTSPPSKRIRSSARANPAAGDDDDAAADDDDVARNPRNGNWLNTEATLETSASLQVNEDDDDELDAAPKFSQISVVARSNTNRAQLERDLVEPKRRTPWSDSDTEKLIEAIGDLGCRWSKIADHPGWDNHRGQVALKDRARNVKVSFLKAKVPLPTNFENVPLGKKEVAAVRAVIPDYEP